MASKDLVKGYCKESKCEYDVYTKEKIDEILSGINGLLAKSSYVRKETIQLPFEIRVVNNSDSSNLYNPVTANVVLQYAKCGAMVSMMTPIKVELDSEGTITAPQVTVGTYSTTITLPNGAKNFHITLQNQESVPELYKAIYFVDDDSNIKNIEQEITTAPGDYSFVKEYTVNISGESIQISLNLPEAGSFFPGISYMADNLN